MNKFDGGHNMQRFLCELIHEQIILMSLHKNEWMNEWMNKIIMILMMNDKIT